MQRFWIRALLLRESSAIMGLEEEKGDGAAVDPENPAGNYCCYSFCFLFVRTDFSWEPLNHWIPYLYHCITGIYQKTN